MAHNQTGDTKLMNEPIVTQRQLFEHIIHNMTNAELADMIYNNDILNMALFDSTIRGNNDKDKVTEFLKQKVVD